MGARIALARRGAFPDTPCAGDNARRMRLANASLLIGVLLVWQLAALRGLPEYLLSPYQIARFFTQALGTAELYENIAASLGRSLPGFILGSALGAVLGLAAGMARWFDRMLSPAVFLTYPVPKIVMLPIFMIWFGIGDLSKVLIIALACFYPVFINAYYGVRQTRTILVWSALGMGASRWTIFRRVVLPSAAPMILASLRVSLALSFIVMFAAEMINARSGLGHMIRTAENSLRFDLMYVSLLAIAILGYAGDRLVRFAHARVFSWQQPA
jgi:NitT/TauT family transport system permease protein